MKNQEYVRLDSLSEVISLVSKEDDLDGYRPYRSRVLLAYDDVGNRSSTIVPPDALVMSVEQWCKALDEPNGIILKREEWERVLNAAQRALKRMG